MALGFPHELPYFMEKNIVSACFRCICLHESIDCWVSLRLAGEPVLFCYHFDGTNKLDNQQTLSFFAGVPRLAMV